MKVTEATQTCFRSPHKTTTYIVNGGHIPRGDGQLSSRNNLRHASKKGAGTAFETKAIGCVGEKNHGATSAKVLGACRAYPTGKERPCREWWLRGRGKFYFCNSTESVVRLREIHHEDKREQDPVYVPPWNRLRWKQQQVRELCRRLQGWWLSDEDLGRLSYTRGRRLRSVDDGRRASAATIEIAVGHSHDGWRDVTV